MLTCLCWKHVACLENLWLLRCRWNLKLRITSCHVTGSCSGVVFRGCTLTTLEIIIHQYAHSNSYVEIRSIASLSFLGQPQPACSTHSFALLAYPHHSLIENTDSIRQPSAYNALPGAVSRYQPVRRLSA